MQYSKIRDSNNEPQKPDKGSFIRLLGYTYKHKLLLIMGNISLVVTSLSMVAIPYLTGQMIDAITKEDGKSELNTLTCYFIAVTIITALFTLVRASAYNILGEKVTIDLRNELFGKLLRKDIEFFDQNRSGELVSRLTSDISLIQSGASDVISIMLRNLIQFFGSLILLWAISWKLTAVLLGVIPPFALIVALFIRYYKQYSKEYQAIAAESTQLATEVLGNMRVVRSFSTEDKEQEAFEKATAKAYTVGVKRAVLGGLFASIGMALGYGVILGILYYGGSLVLSGDLTVGQLSSFVLYTLTMTVSLISVSGMLNIMVQSAAVSEKIFSLIDTPIQITDGVLVQKLQGNITIQNMSFHYPSKEQVQVLNNLSLEIRSGEVIAFVGQSGSGKSTIVALLERFYESTSGQILLDDTDVRLFELKKLHRQIGYVAQEPTLFSGSLRDNITYGVDIATEEEIEQSMKLANAYDFVTNKQVFPEGLNTIVGERGVKLSGGQKQRIAIARALIKNPKILIFDEATSALDSESEYQVQKAIDGLVQSGQKTIILIAHRLSTIINADKIVVIQNGLIAEIGRHEELIAQNGVYKALIERQLS